MRRVCSTPRVCRGVPNVMLILQYVKTLLRNMILPPAGPLLLAIAGLLLLRRRPRLARMLLAAGPRSLWPVSPAIVGRGRLYRPPYRRAGAGHGPWHRGRRDERDTGAQLWHRGALGRRSRLRHLRQCPQFGATAACRRRTAH